MPLQRIRLVLTFTCAMALAACGGGGGGAGPSASGGAFMDGTVAVGAPIAGAQVTARDVNGRSSNTVTADANGQYTGLDLSGLTPPIIIEAVGQLGQTPYRLYTPLTSASAGTANVTSLTTALAGALGNGDPHSMSLSSITSAALAQAKQALTTALAPLSTALNLNLGTSDLVSTRFNADNTGLDKLLDLVDVRVRPDGVSMVNRLEPISEDQGSSDRSEVRLGFNGSATGNLSAAQDLNLSWLQALSLQMRQCFALPAAQRVSFTQDAGGVAMPTSVHNDCKSFVATNYLHNTYSFGERWLFALRDSAFDGAKFKLQLAYIVNNGGTTAYVVNINTADSSGNGYTMPEVVTQVSGAYKLSGNQRQLDITVQPLISKLTDQVSNTSGNNLVAGRLSFFFKPHRDWDATSSQFKHFYGNDNKPEPRWLCAWVTGPALPGEGAMNAQNTGPVGGILLKVPRRDYVAQRNFMAVHVKFPPNFDPTQVQADRNQLLKACAARENVSTNNMADFQAESWSTFNFFTVDAAKSDQNSNFAWPSSVSYSWAGASTTWAQAAGTSFGNWALQPVGSATKAAYKPTSMPLYTFRAFRVSDVPANLYTVPGAATVPVVGDAAATAFFNAGVVVKTRMLGAMPYLSTDANGVYNGNVRFASLTEPTLSAFLAASAADIAAGTGQVAATWEPAAGASGIDRVGITCYGQWTPSGGTKKRWGPSVSSINWGVPRSQTTGSFPVDETCLGMSARTFSNGSINSTGMYRDIWVRTYDQENRQIQRVYLAERQ